MSSRIRSVQIATWTSGEGIVRVGGVAVDDFGLFVFGDHVFFSFLK